MKQNNFEINVIVRDKAIREYSHENKVFVEGRKGSNFELEFINSGHNKVLIVPSVDGLNTLDGTVATIYSKGYIVPSLNKLRIPGWTLDANSIAKFVFSDKNDSYANTASPTKTKNIGVLGFLVFAEKITYTNHMNYYQPWPTPTPLSYPLTYPLYRNINISTSLYGNQSINSASATNSANSASTNSASATNSIATPKVNDEQFTLGTGFGTQSTFVTHQIEFIRGDKLAELTIYYSNKRGLNQRGIDTSRIRTNAELPSAFQTGCTPPPNWKG
jgi:hypothetical protein